MGSDKRAIYESYLTHVRVFQEALKEAAIQDENPPTPTGVTTDLSLKPQYKTKQKTSPMFADAATDMSDAPTQRNLKDNGTQTEVPYPASQPMDMDDLIEEVLLTTDFDLDEQYDPNNPGMTHHVPCTSVNSFPDVKEQPKPMPKLQMKSSRRKSSQHTKPILKAPYKGPKFSPTRLLPTRPKQRIAGNYLHPFAAQGLDPTIRKATRPNRVQTNHPFILR